MKQIVFTLLCLVFSCNAQIKDIQDSPFMNVQITGILRPVFPPSKEELKRVKKQLKKLKNENYSFPFTDEPRIDFDLKVEYFRLPDGRIAAFLTAQIENKELTFEKVNYFPTSKVLIFGRVTPVDNKMRGTFEEEIVFSKNETQANNSGSGGKQSYVKGLLLPPGLYKLTFFLRDLSNNKTGIRSIPLQIPSP